MSVRNFLNRAYDAFLSWYFERLQWQYTRLKRTTLPSLEARIEKRREVSWRWEPDLAFRQMTAKEFLAAKVDPKFLARVGEAYRHTAYGVDPAQVYVPLKPRTIRDIVGTQPNDLPKDVEAFRNLSPKKTDSQWGPVLKKVYAESPELPSARNTLVPGSDKTFAEMGLPIDSTLVVEPVPVVKQVVDVRGRNDVIDELLYGLLKHRSDDLERCGFSQVSDWSDKTIAESKDPSVEGKQ